MLFGFNDYMSDGRRNEKIALATDLGCTAVEFGFHTGNFDEVRQIIEHTDLSLFHYTSIHAPCHKRYDRNAETEQILSQTAALVELAGAQTVVLHPDVVDDWDVIVESGIPFAIENMDCRKDFGKTVDDMVWLHERTGLPVVIDVNHCKTNDVSMKLAEDLVETFRGNIAEFHLSGYTEYHEPLHITEQLDIIRYVDTAIPIIVESNMDDLDAVADEYEYIMANLS